MRKLFQPVIDKLQKWTRARKYKENEYFRIAYDSNYTGIMPIELLKGQYKGIIYCYGPISVGEDLGYRGAQASFSIEVINEELDPAIKEAYLNDPAFAKLTGEILLVVLGKALEKQTDKFISENLGNEEDRENYLEEPVPQRTVRKKNPAISEDGVPTGKKRKKPVRRNTKIRSKVQSDTDA